ncbi:hypothetical protein E2562_031184 [Oryza meyeriana var. granulata]|uniref:DUF834 domain-containing protein n=1 Tax=Oryza meyeriana var. granulata TaxID=110450 RepID=A0A6G1ERJ3_9ORYZ|nr:hypothetical protein E2562_031184 [Oryza meyeriana var. granulata]
MGDGKWRRTRPRSSPRRRGDGGSTGTAGDEGLATGVAELGEGDDGARTERTKPTVASLGLEEVPTTGKWRLERRVSGNERNGSGGTAVMELGVRAA